MSRLCLCLTASTLEGILDQADRYQGLADMAELRLDRLDPDERERAGSLPGKLDIPLILTIRLPEDGGEWGRKGESEQERINLFRRILSGGGWTWVDLEQSRKLEPVVRIAEETGTRIIRSVHDFSTDTVNRPIGETAVLLRSIAGTGAIPKMAVACESSRHLLTLARLSVALDDVGEKVILGMGEFGSPSRILADRIGSAWTYSSAFGGPFDPPEAAPGQLDPLVLQDLYRFRDIDSTTPLYGVMGNPVSHSRSPELHNRWLQRSGLPGCYIPIRSDDAGATLETCDIWGIWGLSVTVPHKETVLKLCDYSGVLARNIGAANTLLRAGDGWRARNTDAGGFMAALPAALNLNGETEIRGLRALVIGAGGAARAASYALAAAGVHLVILNRTPDKARKLAAEVRASVEPTKSVESGGLEEHSAQLLSGGVDFVIQTSAAGMPPLEKVNPLPWWDFSGCRLAYDMIYEPEETLFLQRARMAGIPTLNGRDMLINQARLQFEMFTGRPAPAG